MDRLQSKECLLEKNRKVTPLDPLTFKMMEFHQEYTQSQRVKFAPGGIGEKNIPPEMDIRSCASDAMCYYVDRVGVWLQGAGGLAERQDGSTLHASGSREDVTGIA